MLSIANSNLRERTIIISPLIALIDDQISTLKEAEYMQKNFPINHLII